MPFVNDDRHFVDSSWTPDPAGFLLIAARVTRVLLIEAGFWQNARG
jgi:hypothetical protein